MAGRPKTDGASLVRSENTASRNGPSTELSHGRFVACHKSNFHIKPEERRSTYTRVLHFSLVCGENLGVDLSMQSIVREYIW